MAFRLRADEKVARGLRRLARKELRKAVRCIEQRRHRREEAIHEARRALKKARAIVKVFEADRGQGLRTTRKRLRRVSRSLSQLRDADVKIETLDALRRRAPNALTPTTYALMRRLLRQDRRALAHDSRMAKELQHAARTLRRSRRAARDWSSRHENLRALLAATKAARREGRDAMLCAEHSHTAADFHEWRKSVKTLMYELRLLEAAGPDIRAEIRELRYIERWLGIDHNLVVLWDRLIHDDRISLVWSDVAPLQEASGRYQQELRRKALERGRRIYGVKPRTAAARLQRGWREWRRRHNTQPAG